MAGFKKNRSFYFHLILIRSMKLQSSPAPQHLRVLITASLCLRCNANAARKLKTVYYVQLSRSSKQ